MDKIKLFLINYNNHDVFYFDTKNLDTQTIDNILNLNRSSLSTNNTDTTNFLKDIGLYEDIHEFPNPYQESIYPKYKDRLIFSDDKIDKEVNFKGGCPSIIIYGLP